MPVAKCPESESENEKMPYVYGKCNKRWDTVRVVLEWNEFGHRFALSTPSKKIYVLIKCRNYSFCTFLRILIWYWLRNAAWSELFFSSPHTSLLAVKTLFILLFDKPFFLLAVFFFIKMTWGLEKNLILCCRLCFFFTLCSGLFSITIKSVDLTTLSISNKSWRERNFEFLIDIGNLLFLRQVLQKILIRWRRVKDEILLCEQTRTRKKRSMENSADFSYHWIACCHRRIFQKKEYWRAHKNHSNEFCK